MRTQPPKSQPPKVAILPIGIVGGCLPACLAAPLPPTLELPQ